MPISRSTLPDTLDANLNEIWMDGKDRWPEEYSKVLVVETSTKATEKDSYFSGFGQFPEKTEGSAAQYDTVYQGPSKVYVMITYALKKLDVLKSNFEVRKRTVSVEPLFA
jgi:hypothetical protein